MSKNKNIRINLIIIGMLVGTYSLVSRFAPENKPSQAMESTIRLDEVTELSKLVPMGLKTSPLRGNFAEVSRNAPLMVRFIATWCSVCKSEEPLVREIEAKFKGSELRILEVFSFDKKEQVKNAVSDSNYSNRAVFFDESGEVARSLGINGLPQSMIFDRDGELRYRVSGPIKQENVAELKAVLEGVVKGSPALVRRRRSKGHHGTHGSSGAHMSHHSTAEHGGASALDESRSQEGGASQQAVLPIYGWVPDFLLNNSRSKAFGLSDLKEQVWVANFIFTSCQSMCPILTRKMKGLYQQYQEQKDKVRFVSFSVDPSVDTPEKLLEYTEKNSIHGGQWQFLTGTWAPIKRLIEKGFRLGAPDEPKFHTEKFVLIDQKQRIRGYYAASSKVEMKRLVKDVQKLLAEKKMM